MEKENNTCISSICMLFEMIGFKSNVTVAMAAIHGLWSRFIYFCLQNGCSVRFLNPQAFSHSVWKLTSLLQEYFGCLVGANV